MDGFLCKFIIKRLNNFLKILFKYTAKKLEAQYKVVFHTFVQNYFLYTRDRNHYPRFYITFYEIFHFKISCKSIKIRYEKAQNLNYNNIEDNYKKLQREENL